MLLSLALGLGVFALTLCVQVVPTAILIRIATSNNPRGLTRPAFLPNFVLLQVGALLLALAHLVDIALWALLYWGLCGEFADFEVAYYHSAVNFTTLGYGDIVMSARWRLLGPLEAMNGIVMFSLSTALMFALLTRLIQRRLKAKGRPGGDEPGPIA
jgi:Ion channel